MKPLFTATLLIALLVCVCEGQTISVDFETTDPSTGFPANWVGSGFVIDASLSRQPGTHAARLAGANATLETFTRDIGSLEFYIRAPQPTDDYTVVVESSTNGDNWTPQMSVEQKLTATNPINNPLDKFDAQIKQLDTVGGFRIRWRISRYVSGTLILDDIKLEPITIQARERINRERQEASVRDIVDKQANGVVATANYTQARLAFDDIKDVYQKQLLVLANISDKNRSVAILANTARATAIRNQMANPMNYQAFQEIAANLDRVLPRTKKSRLSDILSGVTRVAGMATTLFTGLNLTGVVSFVDNFKNLLADGYSKQNLDAQKSEGVINNVEHRELVRDGDQKYENAKSFLDIIISENQRVLILNEELSRSSREANALQRDLEITIGEYLRYVGADPSQTNIDKVISKNSVAIADFNNKTAMFSMTKLGQSPSVGASTFALTSEQRVFLREMESKFRRIDGLKLRYDAIAAGMLKFYQDFQQDLNRSNPFTTVGSSTATQWNQQKEEALAIIKPVPVSFKKTYIDVNLYQQ